MHDLILRNRVAGYREGDLMRHVHGIADVECPGVALREHAAGAGPNPVQPAERLPAEARTAFEHHHPTTHVLVAFPLEAWPHLAGAMRSRSRHASAWMGRLTPRERELVPHLLDAIAARGPLGSEDFADERKAHRVVWGAATLVKSTLQKLFFHGRVLIAERNNNRRRYDLPERVLPTATLTAAPATAAATARWTVLLKLRQRRLVTLTRDELRLVEDEVQPIAIERCPRVYCLREDVPQLAAPLHETASPVTGPATLTAAPPLLPPPKPGPLHLLAPLDPLIYDRRLTAALWNFDYTWEAYTPAAKRVRGHYALPVLADTELVGHVEPKADRRTRKLVVASRSVRRGYATQAAVRDLAQWLGART
jgi:uncharacterized protein